VQKRLTLSAAAVLLAVIGLLPVLAMVAKTFYVDGTLSLKAYEAFLSSAGGQLALMGHSLLLSLIVALLAISAGVPLGVLLGKTDLPLRLVLAAIFTIPLLLPPYVLAVAWFAVLGSGGWAARVLTSTTAELLSSTFFGLHGSAGVLFTAFMPIVMLLTIAYVGVVNPRLEDAGRLTSRWPDVLWRITLPIIAPAILFAAALVFLLALGEVGVPTYLRYPVYPVETLTQFAAFYDFGAATVAAIPMLVVTLAILGLEYTYLHERMFELRAAPLGEVTRIRLGRWRLPLLGIVSFWALLTVVMPFAALFIQSSAAGAFSEAFERASDSLLRSIVFAAAGATALTLLGFLCGYLIHDRTLPFWRGVDALALFLFALPGTVIGIGLVSLWNTQLTNAIYATPAIIVLGYLAQYTVLPMRMTAATLQRFPPSLERAAQLSGASWFMTLRQIVAPLVQRGLIASWIVAYIFCLRDLGISMVVYPPGSDTFPVRIMTLMANGAPGLIAALCAILTVATLLPLGVFGLWQSHMVRRSRA
jgi:iron(III) transport system permease protein